MAIPLGALNALASQVSSYYVLNGSKINIQDGTASFDPPRTNSITTNKNIVTFDAGENGLKKDTLYKGSENIDCFVGARNGETVYISRETGEIYNKGNFGNPNLIAKYNSKQLSELLKFNEKVKKEFNNDQIRASGNSGLLNYFNVNGNTGISSNADKANSIK